jgi:hypothetical protein
MSERFITSNQFARCGATEDTDGLESPSSSMTELSKDADITAQHTDFLRCHNAYILLIIEGKSYQG